MVRVTECAGNYLKCVEGPYNRNQTKTHSPEKVVQKGNDCTTESNHVSMWNLYKGIIEDCKPRLN